MRNIKDTCLLFIYCFFTLFTVRADFFYVLAFLAALILCCMDYFIESRGILLLCSFLFLAAAWINPTFLYFLPTFPKEILRADTGRRLCCTLLFLSQRRELFSILPLHIRRNSGLLYGTEHKRL